MYTFVLYCADFSSSCVDFNTYQRPLPPFLKNGKAKSFGEKAVFSGDNLFDHWHAEYVKDWVFEAPKCMKGNRNL
jgi:hypothetical protein